MHFLEKALCATILIGYTFKDYNSSAICSIPACAICSIPFVKILQTNMGDIGASFISLQISSLFIL